MRSLAAEAGVTPATVSLALRNSDRISASTRSRIRDLAKARGYRPDPTVNQLMKHLRTRRQARVQATFACLLPNVPATDPSWIDYLGPLMRGIASRAATLGYAIDRIIPEQFESPRHLQRLLVSRGITGMIHLPVATPGPLRYQLDWERFSVVAATSSITQPLFHAVHPNHFDSMFRACETLLAMRYRRIGLALHSALDQRVHHRWTAALAWHQ
jgi:DNA-binding LacI/PurR family transcriptional regulator